MAGTLKASVQAVLRQAGLYERIKHSLMYDLYWRLFDRQIVEDRRAEVEFYRRTLNGMRKGDLFFDIGANQGQKTDVFLRLGARVIAVDPDETNQRILKGSFHALRMFKEPVTIVDHAVSDRNGEETLWIDEPGSAKNTLNNKWVETLRADKSRFGATLRFDGSRQVKTVTLEKLMQTYGAPFYIKIDVEGHEPCVLKGLERPVPYISFEVNLPEFLHEGVECVRILGRVCPEGTFNYATSCQAGLAFEEWQTQELFLGGLAECKAPSIEVFWRGSDPARGAKPRSIS